MKTCVVAFISLILNLTLAQSSYSQKDKSNKPYDTAGTEINIQEEILLEETDSGEDESELFDQLENLKKNPFDLNEIDLVQLESIPFINSLIAKKIIESRNDQKFFNSKRELLNVSGVTEELYEKIKIYFVVRQKIKRAKIYNSKKIHSEKKISNNLKLNSRYRSRMIQDLQPKSGFLNDKYEGARIKLYNQFNFKLSGIRYNLEANLTLEKDAGEKSLSDFVSGYIELKNYRSVKILTAGDYTVNFGQGISMWSLQAFSKGQDAINPVKKRGKGIGGYGSVNEVQFFRGGAAIINVKDLNFNLFYSDNYYDASSNILSGNINSFYYDGYHRTSTEIQRKNSVKEKLIGGRVSFEKGSYRFGITHWRSKFSKQIIPDTTVKLYKFSGDKAHMTGVDYDLIIKNMNFFGEFALSQSKSIAGINGVQITFFKIADLIISYRNYPENFTPVHSFGFSERGETYNERGFYSGIQIRPVKGLIINSYFDQYKFPYRSYFNPVPALGNDFLANVEWKISKGLFFNIKYKNENKEETQTIINFLGREEKAIVNRNQLNVRTGFIYQLKDNLRLRSRFEYVNVAYKNFGRNNKGYLFYSDIRFKPVNTFVFDIRFIFFDTDSYDSRIYEFENDIQGVMSNIPLYGEGRRWYIVLKYRPFSFINLSVKYAETFFEGVKSIGSGNDEFKGDTINRLSLGLEAGL